MLQHRFLIRHHSREDGIISHYRITDIEFISSKMNATDYMKFHQKAFFQFTTIFFVFILKFSAGCPHTYRLNSKNFVDAQNVPLKDKTTVGFWKAQFFSPLGPPRIDMQLVLK